MAWREQQHGPSVYKWPRGETDGLLHHERAIEIHLPLANAAEREQVGMRNALRTSCTADLSSSVHHLTGAVLYETRMYELSCVLPASRTGPGAAEEPQRHCPLDGCRWDDDAAGRGWAAGV